MAKRPSKNKLFSIGIAALILAGLIIYALRVSAQTYPGHILYPVKRQTENMVLLIKNTPEERIDYQLELTDKRLVELKRIGEDLVKVQNTVEEFNNSIGELEESYEELIKQDNDELSFEYFEKLNFAIYAFMRSVDASIKIHDNSSYKDIVKEAHDRLQESVDNLFDISANNFGDYEDFDKYARTVLADHHYQLMFTLLEGAKQDLDIIRPQASEQQEAEVQKLIDDFESKYNELMLNQKNMSIMEINNVLKELEAIDYQISLTLVEITNGNVEVRPTGEASPVPSE